MSRPVAELVARRAGGVALGLLLSRVVPDLPDRFHPVAWFGSAMAGVERRLWADRRLAGVAHTGIGVAVGVAAGTLAGRLAPVVGVCAAGPQLRRVAMDVGLQLEAGRLDEGRAAVRSLVGRDPSELDEHGVSAAVVESVAENMVDAVMGPAVWGLVGGAPGAAAHRAINTMDAMVGHRSDRYRRYGWASARLDDAVAYVPARLFAVLVALDRPGRAGAVVRVVRRDAGAHPSPNAGVAEAAVAGALGRSLGGTLRYGDRVEHRPVLGDGGRPGPDDIRAVVALTDRIELAMAATLGAVWAVGAYRRSRA
ncbi:MAG: CobD/CbiB family cobalamin biosynthesis protein [Actinomycetota bacterium]